FLEAGPGPDVADDAVIERATAIEVDGGMLVDEVLMAVAQVDAHQSDPIATAVRQRPGVARIERIAEDAHVIAVGAAHHLAPAADAVGNLRAPAAIREAALAHAQAPVPRHR